MPGSPVYEERMGDYFSSRSALDPWCLVMPTSAEDVSSAIKVITRHDCPFGVRAGGHAAYPRANSIEDGITVDLGNMTAVSFDEESMVASIEPGARWRAVYGTLQERGVSVAGGRDGNVGVGGFLLGGGLSYFAASHGLGCDTVANFQLVLGDGSVVDANADANPDLFAALKGSQGNLGIVTRVDMNAIAFPDREDPLFWMETLTWNISTPGYRRALGSALHEFLLRSDEDGADVDTHSWAAVAHFRADGVPQSFGVAQIANSKGVSMPDIADAYYALPEALLTEPGGALMTPLEAQYGTELVPLQAIGSLATSFDNSLELMDWTFTRMIALQESFEAMGMDFYSLFPIFQAMPKSMIAKGIENGGNVSGLDRFKDRPSGLIFSITFGTDDAEKFAAGWPLVKEFVAETEAKADELGALRGWQYLNYAEPVTGPMAELGSAALAKMKAASEKYDPDGVFQRLRKSGFKIPG